MAATVESSENPTAQLFDSVGPAYEKAFDGLPEQAAAVRWLLDELAASHPSGGAQCLDIGCGTGRPVCASLATAGHKVHGIDVSGAMIEAARAAVPSHHASFAQQDVRSLPDNNGSYDAITVFFSMIAGFSQSEIRDTIRRIHAWLRPGGVFVFATVPIDGNNLDIRWMGRPVVVSSLSAEEATRCLHEAGFEIVYQDESKFLPKAVEAGICGPEDVWEEPHLFVYARKK